MLARLEALAERLAAAALLAMTLLIAASVAGRALLGVAVPDDVTLVGLLVVAVASLPLAGAQARDEHLAVTVLSDRLPPPAARAGRRLGCLLGALVFGAIGVLVAADVPEALVQGHAHAGRLQVPVWPMKAVFAAALLLFAARLLLGLMAPPREDD